MGKILNRGELRLRIRTLHEPRFYHGTRASALALGAVSNPPSVPSGASTPSVTLSGLATWQYEVLGALGLLLVGAVGAGGKIWGKKGADWPTVLMAVGFGGGGILATLASSSSTSSASTPVTVASGGG